MTGLTAAATRAAPPRSILGCTSTSSASVCASSEIWPFTLTSASVVPMTSVSSVWAMPFCSRSVPPMRSKPKPLPCCSPRRDRPCRLSRLTMRSASTSTGVMLPRRRSSRTLPPSVFMSTEIGEPRQRTVPASAPAPPATRPGWPKCWSMPPRSSVSSRTLSETKRRAGVLPGRVPWRGWPHRPLPSSWPCGMRAVSWWMRQPLPSSSGWSTSGAPATIGMLALPARIVTWSNL